MLRSSEGGRVSCSRTGCGRDQRAGIGRGMGWRNLSDRDLEILESVRLTFLAGLPELHAATALRARVVDNRYPELLEE